MKTVAAAIDFGTSKIVTLLAESGGFNRCDIIGSGTVPYDGYADGEWNSPEKLSEAIRSSINAAELEAGQGGARHKVREVYVGVPCEYIHVISAEGEVNISSPDGRVVDDDLDNVQDAAAEQLDLARLDGCVIHRSPAWFSVDGGKHTMSPVGTKGGVLRASVTFILADKYFIADIRKRLGEMDIKVLAFLSPALGEALQLMSIEDRDRSAVLIDIGYLNTEVSVVEGDAITYHGVLPLGGGDITADLAQGLRIPMRAAEQIKREYIFMPDEYDPEGDHEVQLEDGSRIVFTRADVQEIIEARVDEIADLIGQTIEEARNYLGARSQVFLTGGGLAIMRGGREYLAEKLRRSVKAPLAKTAKHNSPVFASALGLVDLVFDSIEQQAAQNDSFFGRIAGGVRNLMGW